MNPEAPTRAEPAILERSRALRESATNALARAAQLRTRADRLRLMAGTVEIWREAMHVRRAEAEQREREAALAQEDAETTDWFREQVREMVAAGWSPGELAEIGVTDELLRELGIEPAPSQSADDAGLVS